MVRLRRRCLFALAALLGAVAAVLPAVATSETSPTIVAENKPGGGYYGGETHAWAPSQATVSEGGVVTLSNPTEVSHGVEWRSGPETPSCTAGVPVGKSASASAAKWNGTCTFTKPGTYTFYCTVHGPEMTGTVTVSANGTTTITNTTPTATTTTPTTTTPGQSSPQVTPGSPLAGSVANAITIASRQHGKSVRGVVDVSQFGAGGRLEVALLAASASLAKVGVLSKVRVGRFLRSSLQAGAVAFAVPLTAKGKSALWRHRRLALTVRIVLTPVNGAAVTVTRSVVEHA
jgi:plastocyanin